MAGRLATVIERLAARAVEQRQVGVGRRLGAQRAGKLDLDGRVRDVILAPDDVTDAGLDVVDHGGQRVGGLAVGAAHHRVADMAAPDAHGPAHEVVPHGLGGIEPEAVVGHAAFGLEPGTCRGIEREARTVVDRGQAQRLLCLTFGGELVGRLKAGIDAPGGVQPLERRRVAVQALGLADLVVPGEAEPGEVVFDGGGKAFLRTLRVGVVEAQQKAPAPGFREQPVEQGRARVAHMQPARGARCEADEGRAHSTPRNRFVIG